MKVAIVGGTGMIGQALSTSLLADGHQVVVLSRRPGKRPDGGSHPSLAIVGWSVDDVAGLALALEDVDAVVNLAGARVGPRRWTAARKRELRSSRIEPTRAIVEAIKSLPAARRPRTLVSASGTDGYTRTDDVPLAEAAATPAGFLGAVCQDWEAEAGRATELGLRVVILRIGPVIARDATVLRLLSLPVRLGLGGRLGSGAQWISWVHLEDVTRVVRRALDDGSVSGVLNVVAPTPVRQLDMTRTIGRRVGRPVWSWLPAVLLRVLIGEGASVVLGSRRVQPARLIEAGFDFRYPTIDLAVEEALR